MRVLQVKLFSTSGGEHFPRVRVEDIWVGVGWKGKVLHEDEVVTIQRAQRHIHNREIESG